MNLAATVNRGRFMVKQHAPEILTALGLVGLGFTIFASFKTAPKCNDILEECTKELSHADNVMRTAKLHDGMVTRQLPNGETTKVEYTEKDYLRDRRVIKVKTGWRLVKAAIPVIITAGLTAVAFIFSHKIEKDRLKAATAALGSVIAAFKSYRERVREKYGEDVDNELYYNIKKEKVEAIEDGKKVKKEVLKEIDDSTNIPGHSMYARYFDEGSSLWKRDPEMNLLCLRAQQNAANDYLKANGHLFLNEVYDMLGLKRSKAGQIVGWTYDSKNPKGDNYVDFGIYDIYNCDSRNFVNGQENRILLDFNVDGNILGAM